MWYALLTGRCPVRVSVKGDFFSMKLTKTDAAETAKELTLSAIEHHLIQVFSGDEAQCAAEKVLSFYNTIADALDGQS